jgi:hypothetical protein
MTIISVPSPSRMTPQAPKGGWNAAPQGQVPTQNDVKAAADKIQNLTKDDASSSEIRAAADTLAQLSPAKADAVIDELARRGVLDHFVSEVIDGGGFTGIFSDNGGLSASDQKTFFANLAKQLDGKSLAMVAESLAKTDKGYDRVMQLSEAVAAHGSIGAKIDYVDAMGDGIPPPAINADGLIQNGTNLDRMPGDMQAQAAAMVLGSMNGPHLNEAIDALGPDGFRAVVNMSVIENRASSRGKMSYDTKLFEQLGATLAAHGNDQTKAMFVEFGGRRMREVRATATEFIDISGKNSGKSEKKMMDTLTAVIDSNPTGVMRTLAYMKGAESGNGLASYVHSMLSSGDAGQQKLIEQFASISADAAKSGGLEKMVNGQYVNAAPLAYFAGAISAGEKSAELGDSKKAFVENFIGALAALDPTGVAEAGVALSGDSLTELLVRAQGDLGRALLFGVMEYDQSGSTRVTSDPLFTFMTNMQGDIAINAKPELDQRRMVDYN